MRMFWATGMGAAALGFLLGIHTAIAAVSPEEASRLGGDLTPIGAEKAGNAAGTIPAWDGGLTAPPPGITLDPSKHLPDPFAADQPLYTVSAANMAQYDAQLTEGQKGLVSAYPDSYLMKVYPTHRSCALPAHVYEALKRNAVTGQLVNNGNGVTGATMGPPFPIPQSAREVLWNNELNYRGFKVWRHNASAAPTQNGDFTIDVAVDQYIYSWSDPSMTATEDMKNISYYFLKQGLSPPSNSGAMTVFNNTLDQVAEERRVWNYRPGERKVKRTMGIGYDNLVPSSEGIRASDTFQIFNGAADRYDWKLIGKQEKLIAYNTNGFASSEYQYKDILNKHHLNQDPMRYELHRVWVIEGKVKPGMSHVFASRRRIYLDEDSWVAVAADLYGQTDSLSRVQEAHIFNYYNEPLCAIGSEIIYDIKGGRYHVVGLRNQQRPVKFDVSLNQRKFSPYGIRTLGAR
ncbi:MAG: DUF1329 domain-containing protein [Alphaproteobacteria bacterium]